MQDKKFYSVRMRAAQKGPHERGGKHISGGEILSTYSDLKDAVNVLLEKGLGHSRGKPDFMQIQFEAIHEPITRIKPLQVKTNEMNSVEEGKELSWKFLEKAGIQRQVIEKAYAEMTKYSAFRGAILVDVQSGERMDQSNDKGIRVSRMDWLNTNFKKWADHYNEPKNSRVKEALVLATKVCEHPATVAELCWSDDPEYITGYVASSSLGYQRITKLKEYGDERGCRIFFVDGLKSAKDLNTYIRYLEKQPVIIQWEKELDKF
ncbi:6-carboxyhexanoate--CoA ligase [Alkalihalobacillus sp. BA299]|uniref:6-carboxyhexanoate--CoA ligase n=1 Tax=Alkalihalobacillus sp. BA299 TaxID=2815938 RepID=UPI001ADA2707|nr:6-carboxyhexanoate--CoA ligase [Alkalihalobacillus sp. BA299]